MIYFIYIIITHLFHGNIWTHNWPAPNVSVDIIPGINTDHSAITTEIQTLEQ